MPFHNRLIESEQPADTAERVPFHQLKEGDRYQHSPDGNVSQVIRRDFDFATIKRADDWLIHCPAGGFVWDRMVIKVASLRK